MHETGISLFVVRNGPKCHIVTKNVSHKMT
jgi:hypothetical protein